MNGCILFVHGGKKVNCTTGNDVWALTNNTLMCNMEVANVRMSAVVVG
jgi:hypothetical protein